MIDVAHTRIVEVVSAVIVRAGRVLLTQRRAGADFEFTWESPGGKVDSGEPHEIALRRELVEELGLMRVNLGTNPLEARPLWSGQFSNMVQRGDRAHVRVTFYRAQLFGNETARPLEGQGIGWFTAEEMLRLPLAPANAKAASKIFRLLLLEDR